jgi:hypothetical protein
MAFVEARANGGCTAAVPALPGLATQGRDLNDARYGERRLALLYRRLEEGDTITVEMGTAQGKASVNACRLLQIERRPEHSNSHPADCKNKCRIQNLYLCSSSAFLVGDFDFQNRTTTLTPPHP